MCCKYSTLFALRKKFGYIIIVAKTVSDFEAHKFWMTTDVYITTIWIKKYQVTDLKQDYQENNSRKTKKEGEDNIDELLVKNTWKLAKMVSHKNLLLRGSIPVDGSSSKTTRGLPTMAKAKESFRRVPPEHSSAFFPACSIIWRPLRYASTILEIKITFWLIDTKHNMITLAQKSTP